MIKLLIVTELAASGTKGKQTLLQYTLGPAYKEFGYYELPATASRFLCIKIIVEKFGYNEYPLVTSSSFLHLYRPQRSWSKVIFSVGCVKNSVHRGDTWSGTPQAGTPPLGRYIPQAGTPPGR